MRAILTVLETYEEMDAIEKGLEFCTRQGLYSAADFRTAVEYFAQTGRPESEQKKKPSVPRKYQSLHPQVRSIQEYIQAAEE